MIPSQFIALLTFPGIIIHEIGHVFFCKKFKVKIQEVCYFRFGNPAGYVLYDDPENFKQSFLINVGPFIINNIFAVVAFVFAISFMDSVNSLGLFFGWLGISLAMNSFPSKHGAKALWAVTKVHSNNYKFLKLIGYPFSIIIYVANLLSFIWFDLIWAISLYGLVESVI